MLLGHVVTWNVRQHYPVSSCFFLTNEETDGHGQTDRSRSDQKGTISLLRIWFKHQQHEPVAIFEFCPNKTEDVRAGIV